MDAAKSEKSGMKDFATRIAEWIELPALETLPEQRILLYLITQESKSSNNKFKKLELADVALNFRLRTSRDIVKYSKSDAREFNDPCELSWILKTIYGDEEEVTVEYKTLDGNKSKRR